MELDGVVEYRAVEAAERMTAAAAAFIASLSGEQRTVARYPFEGDERYVWTYTPGPRNGLRLKDMTGAQRTAAMHLISAGLSIRGASEAEQIMALETTLREVERVEGVPDYDRRDPELYYFTVFGEPGGTEPWGWRANGHHVGLNFTIAGGTLVSPTPLFLGANPAEVRHGPDAGTRILTGEEDLARALLGSLDDDQRSRAVVDATAPDDILSKNYRSVDAASIPAGIPCGALEADQRKRLVALVQHYLTRATGELERNAWARIERGGLEAITFAWAGAAEHGQGHYYAVRGPTFLIEYDNTQNDANHIHSVWRDFTNDWDADVLAQHYAAAH